ncbi:glycine zipper 2TM domain-containing protein [Trinickia dinghuensis]|uniref:Glycine zipper 2TM domain-containing protein n=1 Tax=Trinickia dinghuensis TaxID=2291023 RepID=A0A3D8K4G3_9BURK|nr:glycine zipper 2TM domain-containing protein [Trinickia dinghuensis]RDV00358.1 glycine zipper 2TM domain-containing protein [Trinickia dinghuensis]
MKRLTLTKTALLVPLVAASALSLTACVAPNPYGAYGSQPQYAQPAYGQPQYAQPAQPQYAQPQYPQPQYAQPDDQQPAYAPPPPPPAPAPTYAQPQGGYGEQYGTIAGIRPIGGATSPSGVAGTLVGALVGGVIGNQFGRGHGRDAATVVGAVGGAVAGNQIGQSMGQPAGYRVDIQLSDGTMRSLDMQSPGDLRPGDRVRIDGNQISRY